SGFPNAPRPASGPPPKGQESGVRSQESGKKDGAQPAKPPEKAHLIVTTHGPFIYDLTRDFAQFDIPAPDPGRGPALPEQVVVQRLHDAENQLDQLLCEHHELQFRKKEAAAGSDGRPAAARPAAPRGGPADHASLQVETAHATGHTVVLT